MHTIINKKSGKKFIYRCLDSNRSKCKNYRESEHFGEENYVSSWCSKGHCCEETHKCNDDTTKDEITYI